jgi:hypothetical protein
MFRKIQCVCYLYYKYTYIYISILYIHGIHYTTAGALKVFQATALRILLQAMPCLSRMALAAMKASFSGEWRIHSPDLHEKLVVNSG